MMEPDWNDRYRTGDTPWDTGEPDDNLVEFLRPGSVAAARALEIGCGTGTNALWLARQGISVVAVDVSSVGIEKARAKAAGTGLDCRFARADFLNDNMTDVTEGSFNLVFDRGCFHVFDRPEERERFAEQVASLLAPGGRWLSLIGSTEGPARDHGPPRRSARDVIAAIEPRLEVLELRAIELRPNQEAPVAAWLCVSGPRSISAQPSTRRD